MSTGEATAEAGNARRRAPASRIVRIGRAGGPFLAATTVLATVVLAVPRGAWLPRAVGRATSAAWDVEPGASLDAIVTLQVGLGAWIWRSDVVLGAIAVAAACAAAAAALMTVTLRRTGLPAGTPALLALVATAAPFASWSGSSPLGAAPVTLASVAVLALLLARDRQDRGSERRGMATWPRRAPLLRLGAVLALLITAAEALTRARQTSTLAATWAQLRGDLGPIGIVLLAAGAATARRGTSARRVWLGAAVAWLLTVPLPAEVRTAAVLPWAWWLVGLGVANAIAWRGGTRRWAGVSLMAWLVLQAAARPWEHERQQAALVGTWARAMAESLTDAHPLVSDRSAGGRMLATLVARRARGSASSASVTADHARRAIAAGRQPLVQTSAQLESLRWGGLAFAPWRVSAGASVEDILDAVPPGTVTLAVISADASRRLSPQQWQALGRLGLRLPDAATARAHALVGITGARVQALEAAQAGSVRLDVLPGDALGRTPARSPVDARLEAGATHVSVRLRGQVLIDQVRGLALVFFTRSGDLLGWRAGAGPAHLDGPALGGGPAIRAVAVAALPCLTVPAGPDTDVTPLTGSGAIGVTWTSPARVDVTLERPRELPGTAVRLAQTALSGPRPILISTDAADRTFAVQGQHRQVAGIYLRGPVSSASARADHEVRLCAAWPMAFAFAPGSQPYEMPVAPRHEPYFGGGWHDLEVQPGGGYFRWMSGPRAEVLIAMQRPESFTFTLDAQAPLAPVAGDEVRLTIQQRDLGAHPLLPTRGLYAWHVPAGAVGHGVNALALRITRTARPTPAQEGGDARQLGLLVRGWSFGPTEAR